MRAIELVPIYSAPVLVKLSSFPNPFLLNTQNSVTQTVSTLHTYSLVFQIENSLEVVFIPFELSMRQIG